MRKIHQIMLISVFCLAACQTAHRPFVITQPKQLGDLYWHGELTDTKGNRWGVFILPGMKPMFDWGKEGWQEAGDDLADYGRREFWQQRRQNARDSIDFAGDSLEFSRDTITEYLLEGIAEDAQQASANIAENFREAPFGWIPRIIGNVMWGYVLAPTFRIATAPIGVACGGTGATLGAAGYVMLPVAGAFIPPVNAVYDSTFHGIFVPAVGITTHQITYILVLPNREPAEHFDGRFGLTIIQRPDGYIEHGYVKEDEMLIIPKQESLLPEEEPHKVPKKESRKLLKIDYIRQLMREYMQISKAIAEYKGQLAGVEELTLSTHIETTRDIYEYQLAEESEYYIQHQLEREFTKMWDEIQQQLSEQAKRNLPDRTAAYQQFRSIILQ